jgi:hypothetical protein
MVTSHWPILAWVTKIMESIGFEPVTSIKSIDLTNHSIPMCHTMVINLYMTHNIFEFVLSFK